MKRTIETYNEIVGFHYYPNAPKECGYLSYKHRHAFIIRCRFSVSHNEREIEINIQQQKIKEYLEGKYGCPCDFQGMSCESITEELINKFDADFAQVLEDGYGGASLSK